MVEVVLCIWNVWLECSINMIIISFIVSVKEECEKWWKNNNHGMNNLSNIMMLGVTLFKDLLRFVHYILNECNLLSIIAWLMYNMFDIKHKSFLVYEPFPNWRYTSIHILSCHSYRW